MNQTITISTTAWHLKNVGMVKSAMTGAAGGATTELLSITNPKSKLLNFLQSRFYFRKRASTLFAFSELPVARCNSAIDLLSSVWARNSLLLAVVKAVWRSRTL